MNDFSGRTLGKYQLIERLGRGGMADVYKAYQPGLDRFVAVKMMHGHLAEEAEFIERFKREAQSVASLRHAHIVQVIDFDIQDGAYYMVMEFIKGDTLKAYIMRKGVLPVDEALRLTIQLASALDYAHQNGMIHRDIKPANVMFQDNGYRNVVLTDFGIARILDASGLTMSGMTVGTPAYMSPEAGRGAKVDERADIYSLGIVLYEMLSGHVPYDADTPFAVIMKHINDPLPSPSQFNTALPESVEKLLYKALAKEPADRFQSAADFETALRKALENLAFEQSTAVGGAVKPLPDAKTTPLRSGAEMGGKTSVQSNETAKSSDSPPTTAAKSPSRLPIFAVVAVIIVIIAVIALLARPGQPEIAAQPTLAASETTAASETPAPTTAATSTAESTEAAEATDIAEATSQAVAAISDADTLMQAAEAAETAGNFSAAADSYSQLITLDAENADYYVGRGWAYYNQQDWDAAKADFEKATDLDANNADAFIGLGNTLADSDDNEGAVRAFARAVALSPDDYEPARGLGWAYRSVNDYENAIAAFSSAIGQTTDTEQLIDLYEGRGLSYMDLSNSEEAVKNYDEALEVAPDNPTLLSQRGWAYYIGGQAEPAIDDFSKAIELGVDDVRVYLQRAMAYRALGNYDSALADLNTAIDKDENFLDALVERADLNTNYGNDYQTALTDITKAIELNPGNADHYILRGWIYMGLDDKDRAIASFSRAIELYPQVTYVYTARAQAYRNMGDPEKAIADYDSALALDPSSSYIMEERGWTYMELDQPEEALDDFDRAITLNATQWSFFYGRGLAKMKLGDADEAIPDFTEAIQQFPDYADTYYNRGLAYAEEDEYTLAIVDFQDALNLEPDRPEILADLGRTYDDADRPADALETFRKYIEMMGGDADPQIVKRVAELEEDAES